MQLGLDNLDNLYIILKVRLFNFLTDAQELLNKTTIIIS